MKAVMLPHIKRRRRIVQCLALSIAAHTVALSYFYFHPLILQGPFQSLFGITSTEPTPIAEGEDDSTLLQKNQLLEEAFQSILVLSPHLQRPYDMIELAKGVSLAPHSEEDRDFSLTEEDEFEFLKPASLFSTSARTETLDADEPSLPALFQEPDLNMPITSSLQVDAKMTLPEFSFERTPLSEETMDEDLTVASNVSLEASYETDEALLTAPNISTNSALITKDLAIKTDSEMLTTNDVVDVLNLSHETAFPPLFIPPAARMAGTPKQIPIAQGIPHLEEYPFSDLSVATQWNDDFDVDVTFLPNPEGKGYIFSLSLTSNYDLSSHGLKQNLYFVLDRSNSVQKHRFAVFKRATLKALSSMQRSDTFNILLIDKKIALFRPENCTATLKNISAAEAFLDKQEAGGFFASSDIYTKLDAILPHVPENDEVHTVLLLTDGKTEMQAARKQKTLNKWIEKNREKIVLHACAIGKDNDLLSLDMLCSVSGGKLLYSDTHAAFPRKLARLIMDLKDPVAKELTLTTLPHHPDSHIELYPTNTPLMPLYAHQPYIILGQIDHPCSFDLVLQGRHRDQWIAIKKTISFIDGRKGDMTLQKQWKSQQAGTCYSHFLKEGKAAHLQEAREILKQSRSEVAFE